MGYVWSPLAPSPSGIANYTETLIAGDVGFGDLGDQSIKLRIESVSIGFVLGRIGRIGFNESFFNLMHQCFGVHRVKPDVGVKCAVLVILMVFMVVLVAGLGYAWRKGAFVWK